MMIIVFTLGLIPIVFDEKKHFKAIVVANLRPISDATAMLGIVGFILCVFVFNVIIGLVVLLFFAQMALHMQLAEHRQVPYGLIVSFVALMVGAASSKHMGFVWFMVFFGLFASLYIASAYLDKCKPYTQQGNGLRITPRTHGITLLLLCGLAVFIYLLLPRFPAGNLGAGALKGWGQYGDNHGFEQQLLDANKDLKDEFSPEPQTERSEHANQQNSEYDNPQNAPQPSDESLLSNAIYYYVKSPRPLYLQNQTRTYFDGRSWHALQNAYQRVPERNRQFTLYPVQPNTEVEITTVQDTHQGIIAPSTAVAIDFPSDHVGRDYYDGLSTGKTLKKDTTYQLHLHDQYQRGRLVDAHQAPPDLKDLQLPRTQDPRIRALVHKIAAKAESNWDKAVLLEQHLRTQYRYSLSTVSNQNNIPVADFLFNTRHGHCEYFATSLAIMLRHIGIPARMATGFVAQEYNPVTGFYEVKGIHGHAWVNAYLDGKWVVMEATGAYALPTEALQNTQTANEQLKDYIEKLQEQQELLEENAKEPPFSWKNMLLSIWATVVRFMQWLFSVLAILGAVAAVLWLGWRWLYAHKKHQIDDWRDARNVKGYKPKHTREDVDFYMRHIQRLLKRSGVERTAGMPIEAYMQAVQQYAQTHLADKQARKLQTIINQHYYQNVPYTQTDRAFFVSLYQALATVGVDDI